MLRATLLSQEWNHLSESIGFCWLNIFHTGEINAWLQDETSVSSVYS